MRAGQTSEDPVDLARDGGEPCGPKSGLNDPAEGAGFGGGVDQTRRASARPWRRRGRGLGPWLACIAILALPQAAQPGRKSPWSRARAPSRQPAASLGGYSHGCVAGAQELALRGDNHIVMRPSRRRNFGHPELVNMVLSLAAAMKAHGLGRLAVGDLGQVRGGPAPNGHKSHQSGLDADLWYVAPQAIAGSVLPKASALETIGAQDLVRADQSGVTAALDAKVMSIVRRVATDRRVARIFVNPRIKQAFCDRTRATDRAWLRKIRPWWGHSAHFHVRLKCPAQDALCENQADLPAGDGCGALAWWFDEKAQAERKKGRADYRKNMGKAPTMPQACEGVLAAPAQLPGRGKR